MGENQPAENATGKSTAKHIRGSTLLFGGRIVSIGIKFFLQILIVRYLTKSDYGAFAYAINLVEIAAILSAMSLEKAASRFMPIYDENGDYDSLYGFIVLSFISIFGIGISIALLLAAFQSVIVGTVINDPLVVGLLLILIALAPFQAFDSWFQALFATFSSVRAIFFRRYIVWPSLQLLAIVFVMITQSDVYTLAWGYFFGGLVGTGMYFYMAYNLFKNRGLFEHFSWRKLKFNAREIYGFSLPTLSSGLVVILSSQIVVVLLEYFRDTSNVAEFRAVFPVAKLNTMVYESFVFLYMPLVARMLSKNDSEGINDLYWRTTAWISMASLPVFLVSFALSGPIVPLLFGSEYTSSALVLSILSIGFYFNAVLGFNVHTLRVYGVVKYLLGIDILIMVVSIVGYVLLIPPFGAVGGAIGYTAATILANILNHCGLALYTEIRLFDWSYIRIYVMILFVTTVLGAFQVVFAPSLFISVPLAAVLALSLLYLNRAKLMVGEIFPELLKIPFVSKILEP